MPFTFSHPAIVLPLTYFPKRCISLTGLIIGSMVPDFEYFLRMTIECYYGHELQGILFFDLPFGLILCFIFHNIVRNSLVDNLPLFLRRKFSNSTQFNWNIYFKMNWIIVIVSILIGSLSHIFWDSFTHVQRYFVQTLPFLRETTILFGKSVKNYQIIQQTSSLFGGIFILLCILKLPSNEIISKKTDSKYWGYVILLSMVIISLRFLFGLNIKIYGNVVVTIISAFLLSLILTPIINRFKLFDSN